MRVADKELTILTVPLYTCLNDLAISGGQTDIQCLMAQLQIIGQQLEVTFLSLFTDIEHQQGKNQFVA